MNYCQQCGHQLEENQTFCTNCGAKVVESQNVMTAGEGSRSRRPVLATKKSKIFASIGVLLILVIASSFFISSIALS
ncbi:zinc-ribbon domain-containing protein [Aeribacillus sp. FSL k6-2211]|uniref:zinc-ribbon domain-containing protein n=1 Tax=Aeribacillus sp. FSL k6-2211 TaxID=2954608 RepID=UPI0030CC5917